MVVTLQEVVAELRLIREQVSDVKEILSDMMEGKKHQRKKDAERKRKQRNLDMVERNQGRISLPDFCPVETADKRLKERGDFLLWAHVGMEFGKENAVRSFFTYIAAAWNESTYFEKVITRSGNKPHVWRCNVRRRSVEAWSTIFGSTSGRVTDLDLSDLSSVMWFNWGYVVFRYVWDEMRELPGFKDLPDRFIQACLLVQGGMGEFCINEDVGLYFDPHNCLEDLRRMKPYVPALWYAWNACREGLEIASFEEWKKPFNDLLKTAGTKFELAKKDRDRKAAGEAFLNRIRAQRKLEETPVLVALPSPEQVEQMALDRAITLSLEDQKEAGGDPEPPAPPASPASFRPQNPDDVEHKSA